MLRSHALLSHSFTRYALPAVVLNLALPSITHCAPADNDALEEVVVTAQFRRENLQDTPIAITAITVDTIENRGFSRIEDVAKTAPNVSLRPGGAVMGQAVQAYIRGVGQYDSDIAREPGVGIYIDDVYHATLFGSTFDLLDLERVEVLRGPQGTLAGKNSIGGAIRLVTAKPSGSGTGSIEATTGKFDRIDFKAGYDMTIVPDKVFMRLSAFSKQRDGYVDLVDFVCANPGVAIDSSAPYRVTEQPGHDSSCKTGTTGGEDVKGARLALNVLASDRVEINLTGDYSDNNSEAVASELVAVNDIPWNNTVLPDGTILPVGINQQFFLPQQGLAFTSALIPPRHYQSYNRFDGILVSSGPPNFDVTGTVSVPQVNTVRQWGVAGTLDLAINDSVQLKSISSYRKSDGATTAVLSSSPLSIGYQYQVFGLEQFSQEIRLTGNAYDRLDWAVGTFYFRGDSSLGGAVAINGAGLNFQQHDSQSTKDIAFFAQGTYHILEPLSVTLGARYTKEDKSFKYDHSPGLGALATPTDTYKVWTPRVTVDYQLTPDVLTYASYSRGFRAGGFNSRLFFPSDLQPYAPEYLDSYELGLKTQWFDRALTLNGAVYYGDYTDLQMSGQVPRGLGLPPFLGPKNIGKAQLKGVELELVAQPVPGLLINGSFGFADYQYKRIDASFLGCDDPRADPTNCQAGGPLYNSMPQGAPRTTGNLGVEYRFELGNVGSLTPRVDANYESKVYWTLNNDSRSATPAKTLIDARLTYMDAKELWTVAAGVTNLTDKFYYLNYNDLYDTVGLIEGQPSRPREWSLTVRRKFE